MRVIKTIHPNGLVERRFEETEAEKAVRLEREALIAAIAELQEREKARDKSWKPKVDVTSLRGGVQK